LELDLFALKKLGVIHYNTPGADLPAFLKWAADAGFEYLELMPPDVEIDNPVGTTSIELAKQTRDLVKSYGLRVSAFSARNDFVVLEPAQVEYQVARMRRVAEVVKVLDDEAVLRSEGGWEKPEVPQEKWGEAMYACFSRCLDFADELNVDIAIDNHGTITNDADLLIGLLKRLDHPRVGANLDTMNFRWYGHDAAACNAIYEKIAPFVKHVHLKDGVGVRKEYKGRALGEGDVDLEWALRCLRAVGYSGAYDAEYEGPETDGGVGYAKCLAWMKAHV
jgi:sugar phosphate isomerase/epimerase